MNYAEHLQIFTDGSKNQDNAVSAAMVIPERNIKIAKRLSNQLSIYVAELTAINYALSWIDQQTTHSCYPVRLTICITINQN